MTNFEMVALRAKVNCANAYLNRLMTENVRIESTDIFKVVTRDMREYVTITEPEVAKRDGMDIVTIKSVA